MNAMIKVMSSENISDNVDESDNTGKSIKFPTEICISLHYHRA